MDAARTAVFGTRNPAVAGVVARSGGFTAAPPKPSDVDVERRAFSLPPVPERVARFSSTARAPTRES